MYNMRVAVYGLTALLLLLQYPLWFGSGGVATLWRLNDEIAAQQQENAELAARNRALAAEVMDLKEGLDVVEGKARMELGMVKRREVFIQVIDRPLVK